MMERFTKLSKFATSDFIAAPSRINPRLVSQRGVKCCRTPEEVCIVDGHVSVKWLSRVTIITTSRLDKPSKMPVDVRDPECVSLSVTIRTCISYDRHVTSKTMTASP